MENDIAVIVSKITVTFPSVTLNLSYCRLLIMVPACARLAVSVASLHPSLVIFELIETICHCHLSSSSVKLCLVAGKFFFLLSEVWS
jgi:hypothetical protein